MFWIISIIYLKWHKLTKLGWQCQAGQDDYAEIWSHLREHPGRDPDTQPTAELSGNHEDAFIKIRPWPQLGKIPHRKDGNIRDIFDDLGLKQILIFLFICFAAMKEILLLLTLNSVQKEIYSEDTDLWYLSVFLWMHSPPFAPLLHPFFGSESRAA